MEQSGFDLISYPRFKIKVNHLKHKAAVAGECTVISHDETYKTLFCLIGQEKMRQKVPNMYARRSGHRAVALKNKMFVLGISDCRQKFNCDLYDDQNKMTTNDM